MNKVHLPFFLLFCSLLMSEARQTCNDESTECDDDETCCLLKMGDYEEYGCCPMPRAICCDDEVHCCPEGCRCNLGTYTCYCSDGSSRPMRRKTRAKILPSKTSSHVRSSLPRLQPATTSPPSSLSPSSLQNVMCPDYATQCPNGYSCCISLSGRYTCCPYRQATCCPDHVNCCPYGYYCLTKYGRLSCQYGGVETRSPKKLFASSSKQASNHLQQWANEVQCPDKQHTCPDGSTCCSMEGGDVMCCPHREASCCSDGVHCCPSGFTCDTVAQTCTRKGNSMPARRKIPAKKLVDGVASSPQYIQCPGKKSYCRDGQTCCQLEDGQYGCCPLPNAVCCANHKNCCPSGFQCDVVMSRCYQSATDSYAGMSEVQPATDSAAVSPSDSSSLVENVGRAWCPDGMHYCSDGQTCCRVSFYKFGCCPVPEAVCCEDHKHCCPHGYKCDGGSCASLLTGRKIPLLVKTVPQLDGKHKPSTNKICPDRVSACPDQYTCCKLEAEGYGCCPLPRAVCCSDHENCCPRDYRCTSTGTCFRSDGHEISAVKKVSAIRLSVSERTSVSETTVSAIRLSVSERTVSSVKCADIVHECPDGNTCCLLATGEYGCCPLPKAVCCEDKIHCCPNGYTCSESGACVRADGFKVVASKKVSAIRLSSEKTSVSRVQCSPYFACPDGNTCCAQERGEFGCCVHRNAVCCEDMVHCCPHGQTCTESGACVRADGFKVVASKKVSAIRLSPEKILVSSVKCADKVHECPDGNTCCLQATGEYGCCPLPKAVCCEDKIHCCPNGFTCSEGFCTRGSLSVPASTKHAALLIPTARSVVKCPDGNECSEHYTCCEEADGRYGCCPFHRATCCDDHRYCCPHGFNCKDGSCMRGVTSFPAALKQPSTTPQNELVCPDKERRCPDKDTCCKISADKHACCPYHNAVCCADMKHCCPTGYSCADGRKCNLNLSDRDVTATKIQSISDVKGVPTDNDYIVFKPARSAA